MTTPCNGTKQGNIDIGKVNSLDKSGPSPFPRAQRRHAPFQVVQPARRGRQATATAGIAPATGQPREMDF